MSSLRYARLMMASFVCLAVAKPVFSAEINVPTEQPTIQAAINAATSGDVIRVAPGDYLGNLQSNGKNVRLESTGGPEVTTIRGSGGTVVNIGGGAALIGFTVTGGQGSFGGGMTVYGQGTLIRGNIFERNSHSTGGSGAAIDIWSASPVIEGNVFRYNSSGGDTQFSAGVISVFNYSSPRIVNNLFYDNSTRAINITVPEGNAPVVINNTIVRNTVGIRVDARIPTIAQTYRNNLIVGNGKGLEIDFGYGVRVPTWDHNLVYGNTANYTGNTGINDLTGVNGNISAAPSFDYRTTTDFRLSQNSPAIDAGSNTAAPSEDYARMVRPRDGDDNGTVLTDIGAHEFHLPQQAPVATADSATVSEDSGATSINVLANDRDVNADTLTISSAGVTTAPQKGQVQLTGPAGAYTGLTYTPAPDANETDTFEYTISDGQGYSATAVVTVTIVPVNDAPTAEGQDLTTPEDTATPITLTGSDVDGDTLTYSATNGPHHGQLSGSGNSLSYTPAANYNGSDSFSFRVNDGAGGSATATVNITVTAVNDDPDAVNDSATVAVNSAATAIPVLANDMDAEGDNLTILATSTPSRGTITLTGPVNARTGLTYQPNRRFSGSDTFTYTISDGHGGTDTATVTIIVGSPKGGGKGGPR